MHSFAQYLFLFIFMRVELWANHMGYYWGAIGNALANRLGTWAISWEHDENLLGNTLRTRTKLTLSTPPQNEKTGLIMGYVCWAFLLLLPSENPPRFQEIGNQIRALRFSYHQSSHKFVNQQFSKAVLTTWLSIKNWFIIFRYFSCNTSDHRF